MFNTVTNPIDGAEMILIPAGEFLMGSEEYEDEKPQRQVYVDAYYIYKTPVTVAQYRAFCQATKREMPDLPVWSKDDHPIVRVTWKNATAYTSWAGARLPTEAQWEKAARGTDGREYPWGNEWDVSKCNNWDTGPHQTTPVGSYPQGASPYGVLDMAGNVWEWCADWYDENYYQSAPDRNPPGPDMGTDRVLRGGSWYVIAPDFFRCAYRRNSYPNGRRSDQYGFRCARTP
jgi:sulfatase modifying factor 1